MDIVIRMDLSDVFPPNALKINPKQKNETTDRSGRPGSGGDLHQDEDED
jgi:hypothetical protein